MRLNSKFVLSFFSLIMWFMIDTNIIFAQYLKEVWQNIDLGENIGGSNLLSVKLAEKSTSEVIIAGGGGSPNTFFAILQYQNESYSPVWASKRYNNDPIKLIEVADIDSDDVNEIYVILRSGKIDIYSGDTITLIRTVTTQAYDEKNLGIGDVDNDGNIDFTFIGTNYLKIYDASTFALKWDTTVSNLTDVKIGDIDKDGNSELVFNNGIVLDGKTHEVKWSYAGGFGSKLKLFDINRDGILEILSLNNQYITAFSGLLQSPLWQINSDSYPVSMEITDLQGDGDYEILVGLDQWSGINVYSASSRQLLWHLNNPEHGVTDVGYGDPNNDGTIEIFWGAGQSSTGPDKLIIASSTTREIEWQSTDLDGPFFVSASDIDNDGNQEIIGASSESNSRYNGGNIMVFDGTNHNSKWISGPVSWSPIYCIMTGRISNSGSGQILVGTDNSLIIFDGITHQQLQQIPLSGGTTAIDLADVDNDGITEIITGGYNGYVTILNGETYIQKWQSINMGSEIKSIKLINCDSDSALEIIFIANNGLQAYDGSTHLLEWQIPSLSTATVMDIGDIYYTGEKKILLGRSDGKLSIVDCQNHTIDTTVTFTTQSISSILIANLDSIPGNEILVGTDTLIVVDPLTYSVKWKSDFLGSRLGDHCSLQAVDLENTGYRDVIFSTTLGIYQFRSSARYPDITPPIVVSHDPKAGLHNVGTNASIALKFSESLAPATITESNVLATSLSGDIIQMSLLYDQPSSTLQCIPQQLLPSSTTITVRLKGSVTDSSGNGLDGNKNGIPDGSPIDDFYWSFFTGPSADTIGPNVIMLNLSNQDSIWNGFPIDSVWDGIPITVHASVTDSTGGAMSTVTAVECFIDSIQSFGSGIPLIPVDGHYGSLSENVSVNLSTEKLAAGNHLFFIHGKDQYNNWGPVLQHSFVILAELAANWSMFGQNPQHTGFNQSDSISLPLQLQWKKDLSMGELNPITVANDLIFATNRSSTLKAIDIHTGTTKWDFSFGQAFSVNPPSFAYGYVYVQREDQISGSYLYAFDALTGNCVWNSEFSAQWEKYLAPTISSGKVFINGGYYGGMYAYDASTGQQLWFRSLSQYDSWTPAVFDSKVYAFVGESGGTSCLVAADVENGFSVWEKYNIEFNWNGWSMFTAPVIDTSSGIIFTTSRDYLHAVDLESQNVLWKETGLFNITPAVAYGKVFSINSGILVVYDEATGDQLWSFTGDSNLSTSPVISNFYVFVSSPQNTYAININTQKVDWNYAAGGNIVVANNHLYISDASGMLYAFERATTSANSDNMMPIVFQLYQNYPNPFNPQTTIQFDLPKTSRTQLKIYNTLGQEIKTLMDEIKPRGRFTVTFNATGLSSGVYFYRLQTEGFTKTNKFVLLK